MGNSQQETRDDVKSRQLPDFEAPPINEVVCGLQFDTLDKWQTSHFGLFWQTIREDYPTFEDQHPLAVLGDPMSIDIGQLGLLGTSSIVPLRRVWLKDATGRHIVQIDPPRFLHNWRRTEQCDTYPRFEVAFTKFTQLLKKLRTFISENSLGDPRFNQYELTYVNHIIVGEDESATRSAEKYVTFCTWSRDSSTLERPVALSIDLRLPLPDKRGMMSVSAKSGTRKSDSKQVLILNLTARGTANPSGEDMREWFDLAHKTIVKGFAELTTPEAHTLWRRTV